MAKEALYLVHAELEASYVDTWNTWHARASTSRWS